MSNVTPKEKARQIVVAMYNNIGLNAKTSTEQCVFEAKKCAIIAVDYIINEWNSLSGTMNKGAYWMQVRKEVERFAND